LTKAGLPLETPRAATTASPAMSRRRHLGAISCSGLFRRYRQQGRAADVQGRNKPFVLVFWSRDPDGTQHNHGDSSHLTPGINGP